MIRPSIAFILFLGAFTFQNLCRADEKLPTDPYAKVRSFKLSNGLKVVVAPDTDAKTFQIKVRVDAGVFNEEENKAGTAHLLEHYLFTDAKSEKDMTYLEVIKEKGGSGNARTMQKATEYFATVPAKLAPWIVGVFGKIMFEKSFDEARVQQAKGPVFLEIGRPNVFDYMTYALQSVWPNFARTADFWKTEFGIQEPMQRASADKIQTARLTSADLKSFYDRAYSPGNMTLFLAGNFDEATMLAQLGNDFGAEPKREGWGWVDPTPHARIGNYFRSRATATVPMIDIGTKVTHLSLEDEVAARMYLEFLSHRLMKELRNVRGQTYTVRPDVELTKGSGALTVKFEAPDSDYKKNLKYVSDLIDSEARRGEFTEAMFNEARALAIKDYERMDHDSGTMMYMAVRTDYIEKEYGLLAGHSDDYQALTKLTYADFNQRLKSMFANDMKVEDLSEPPVFFRFESIVLMILVSVLWMRFNRRLFAKSFDHSQIRWVRKVSYPPAYVLQFWSVVAVLIFSYIADQAIDVFWAKISFFQQSFIFSEYLSTVFSLGVALFLAQCLFAVFARKMMVVGDSFWVKSLGYYSSQFKLAEIDRVECHSPFSILFSPPKWMRVKYRFYYYDMCFWRKGLLVQFKDGRASFIGVRSAVEAQSEMMRMIEKKVLEEKPGFSQVA